MINRYERLNQELKMVETKRKVAAYCRVSTDNEDQANSFESQQRYFRQYIERNPDWELYEIFADEGISGTNTKKRKEFNRMIACAKNGDFDLIITKEISRFARNTLDSIYYTRELKKHGVGVIFMNDNINTLDGDAELRLAIMSSIAQEESRKTSERVKWGQKRQMEQNQLQTVAAIRYVTNGSYIATIREFEAIPCSPEMEPLMSRLKKMADKFEASTNAVKEVQDQELLDFTARKLVEMAADIIMCHLLIQDASKASELFSKSAHVYLNYAEAEVEKHSNFIENFDKEDLAFYKK